MTTHTPKEVQEELIRLRFDVGPRGADGDFGPDSWKGLNEYLKSIGRTPIPETLQDASHLVMVLPLIFHPKENNVEDPAKPNWLSGFVLSTAGQYLIAIVATFIASKLGLDPTTGKADVAAVIVQIVGLIPAAWGIWQSAKSKLVVNGVKVSVAKMSPTDQATVAAIADKHSS